MTMIARSARRLATAAATLLISACVTDGTKEMVGIDTTPEAPLVDAATADGKPLTLVSRSNPRGREGIEGEHGPVELPQLRAYVRGIVDELLQASPEFAVEAREIDVFVVSNPTAFAVSATPGGDILVGVGAFQPMTASGEIEADKRIDTEDGLAFVLGHEIAHIARGHFEREEALLGQRRLGFLVETVLRYADDENIEKLLAVMGGSSDEVTLSPETKRTIVKLRIATRALAVAMEGLLNPSWKREQEQDADRIGLDLMRAAGYSEAAATAFVAKMQEIRFEQKQRVKQKLQEVFDLLGELYEQQGGGVSGWAKGQAVRLGGVAFGEVLDLFAADYDSPQERQDELVAYLQKAHGGAKNGFPSPASFDAALAKTRLEAATVRLQAAVRAAEALTAYEQLTAPRNVDAKADDELDIVALINAGEGRHRDKTLKAVSNEDLGALLADAEAEMKKSISGGWGGDQPYIRLIAHRVRAAQATEASSGKGRLTRFARLNLELGLKAEPVNPKLFADYARLLARDGDGKAALDVLDRLQQVYPTADFYDVRAEVLHASGDTPSALAALRQCLEQTQSTAVIALCEDTQKRIDADRTPAADMGTGADSEPSAGDKFKSLLGM